MDEKSSINNFFLSIKDLDVRFYSRKGIVNALRGISFGLKKEHVLGIVGESGSGKSTLALSILNLISEPGRIEKGQVIFKGRDLLKISKHEMDKIRGKEISMIFSNPTSAFDPTLTVGSQVIETIQRHHKGMDKKNAKEKALDLFKKVKIPSPEKRFSEFPSMFSGGMIQRVMIADALSSDPELIIADNPTQALDVTIQAQILELIAELKKNHATTVIFITNSLPILARYADQIMVLYAGSIVEHGEKHSVLENPCHPYTKGLIDSIPPVSGKRMKRLRTVKGFSLNRLDYDIVSSYCIFADRCYLAQKICFSEEPKAVSINDSIDHLSKCFFPSDVNR